MFQHARVNSGSLDNTAVLSDVAPHDCDTACFAVRIVNRADAACVLNVGILDILRNSFARCSNQGSIDGIDLGKLSQHCRQTSRIVQVVHVGRAGRGQVTEIRNPAAVLVKQLQVKINTGLVGNCQQMENCI